MALYKLHIYGNSFPYIFHNCELDKTDHSRPHWHEAIEILALEKGECRVAINTNQFTAEKGDIVIINSGEVHSIMTNSGCRYYCAILEPEMWKNMGVDIKNIYFKEKITSPELMKIFDEAGSEKRAKNEHYRQALMSMVSLIGIYILRNCVDTSYKGIGGANLKKIQTVKKTLDYIEKNVCGPFSVEAAAKELAFTKCYLCHVFKEITGMTIITYLNERRCDIAEKMIISGDMQISEVAMACGFDNFSYFSRTYKKYKGTSPSKTKG